jgi:hypothetical protein
LVGNPDDLEAIVARARALLGGLFDDLDAIDSRVRMATGRSTHRRHRLMELIESVRRSARSLRGGHPAIDVTSIVELNVALDLLERWRNDPAWPAIIRSLKNPTDFPHAIVTLAAASYLTDAGNGVGIQSDGTSHARVPDLWIAVGPRERMAIEVKAPLALQQRLRPLRKDEARRVVHNAFRRAGVGPRGQLSAQHPGLLLIGGFHLLGREMEMLEEAARVYLSRRSEKRRHIAGVILVSVGTLVEGADLRSSAPVSSSDIRLRAILTVRVAMNPGYDGALRISTME